METKDHRHIQKEAGFDILDIVMDFQAGRKDASQTMEAISSYAQISFKAGEEAERARHDLHYCEKHKLYYCDCCPDCFEEQGIQKGRREVVEWFEKNAYYCPEVDYEKWQAQVKEWGL